ncbi:3-isopropylmalate dehydrogenase [SAR86 cluster bacterium]|nr:3-isopropylmalate dehydrogenase [SAR86 cluster bacterium]
MNKKINILLLPGDGVGPEVCREAKKIIQAVSERFSLDITLDEDLIGGASIDKYQTPISNEVILKANSSNAILLGGVGGPKWDNLPPKDKPEKGLLRLRSELDFFANLRPSICFSETSGASTLKKEIIDGLDLLIVRELTGGIYFGEPRKKGDNSAYNTMIYSRDEIKRISEVAFESAMKRDKKLCSVDKANVLEVSELWREVVEETAANYPEVKLDHMLVDNAAMQLVKNPKQFDVIVSSNLFGDILSDIGSMLTGSIGMLPSASLDKNSKGLYEPVHGTAPDIAGKGIVNPIATILSVAMMFKYSFELNNISDEIESAVKQALSNGYATKDIAQKNSKILSTEEMGSLISDYV